MRLFITGASGLLGANLAYLAVLAGHEVLAAYNEHKIAITGCKTVQIDLLTSDFALVKQFKPDAIIHCAALTNVDLCETDRKLAYAINVETTKKLAELAKSNNVRLIFISTDSIFDGKKPFHKEDEKPHALNYYAENKIEAEEIVRNSGDDNYVIVRTNFYGFNIQNKQSFSEWLHTKFINKEKITAFTDFYFCPLVANNLCEAILELVESNSDFRGTLHVAGDSRLSKYEFALQFADIFGFDRSLVVPTKMSELKTLKAKRPSDCSLDISKAKKVLKTKLLDSKSGIMLYKRLFDEGYQKKLRGE